MREIILKTAKRKTTVSRMAVRKAIQAVFREEKEKDCPPIRIAKKAVVKKEAIKKK